MESPNENFPPLFPNQGMGEMPTASAFNFRTVGDASPIRPDQYQIISAQDLVPTNDLITETAAVVNEVRGSAELLPYTEMPQVHIKGRAIDGETRNNNGAPDEGAHPNLGGIVNAATAGETITLNIRRDHVGAPVRVVGSEAFTPDNPITGPAEDVAPMGNTEQQPKVWARMIPKHHATAATDTQAAEDTTQDRRAMNLPDFLSKYDGPFDVRVEAKGVMPAKHEELIGDVDDKLYDAQKTRGPKQAQNIRELQTHLNRLHEAQDTALVQQGVTIGAPDAVSLARAERAASSLFPSDASVTWTVEKENGRIKSYPSAKDALAAGASLDSLMTAEEVQRLIQYPTRDVPGFSIKETDVFAANREVRDKGPTIKLAGIYDNEGNYSGQLEIPIREIPRHMAVLGAAGSGKTAAIIQLATGVKEAVQQGTFDPENPTKDCAVIYIDLEKNGIGEQVAKGYARSSNLSEENRTVRVIRPGEDTVQANINPLKPVGRNTPLQQKDIATSAFASRVEDADAKRVLGKWGGQAIGEAYTMVGANLATGKSDYECDTPPTPDLRVVAGRVPAVLDKGYGAGVSQVSGDIKVFASSEADQPTQGSGSDLFVEGYQVDFSKLTSGGTTVFELGEIKNTGDKQMALTTILRSVDAELQKLHPLDDATSPDVMIIIDEPGAAYNNNPDGQDNARYLAVSRSRGMAQVLLKQGGVKDLHPDVRINTSNKLIMNVGAGEDLAAISQDFALPEDGLRELVGAEPGEGVFRGPGMQKPVRIRTFDPRQQPLLHEPIVEGPEALLDKGADREFYTRDVRRAARDLLQGNNNKNKLGLQILGLAEENILLQTGNAEGLAAPAGKILEELNKLDPKVRDCAVTMALTEQVTARPDIMHAMTRLDLTTKLRDFILDSADGKEPSAEPDLRLTLNNSRYNAVKRNVVPPALELGPIADILGESVKGQDGFEQFRSIQAMESRAFINVLKLALLTGAGEEVKPEAAQAALSDLGKIVGLPTEKTAEVIRANMQQQLARPLRPKEEEFLSGLETKLKESAEAEEKRAQELADQTGQPKAPPMRITYGYVGYRLDQHIKQHQAKPAIDMSDWNEKYGEIFTGQTMGELYKDVVRHEGEYMREHNYKVNTFEMILAPELINRDGDIAIDRVVRGLGRASDPHGAAIERQKSAPTAASPLAAYALREDLPALFNRTASSDIKDWSERIGVELIHSPDIDMPRGSRLYLQGLYNDAMTTLRVNGMKLNQRIIDVAQAAQQNKS
jgi:hypothetical protein